MIRKLFLLFIFFASFSAAHAGNKIKFYFNHPVDNTVSTGENAIYLSNTIADTIVAYINKAKYTVDVAVYNFSTGSFASISTAINNAYAKGVKVRWIYDGSSTNSGLPGLNSAIKTLGSPTTSSYTIMHNKFMVIDAYSPDPSDAIVWTGSTNWNYSQFSSDYNNVVIIQDSALAHAYTGEFNQMWGGTGIAPNTSLSKFGSFKSDLGRHNFTVDGYKIELYFSPSDKTNSKIQAAISSANKDLYFGVYTFTDNSDASAIMSKNGSGVYVAGIMDSYSNTYAPYSMFTGGLGSRFISYSGSNIYHSKLLIVDPSDKCSDPLVLTGSHNWTAAADTKNDENTLVIHSDVAANIYYQSFKADFKAMGGTITPVTGCLTAVPSYIDADQDVAVYPNPTNGVINIHYHLASSENVTIAIYNTLGQNIATLANSKKEQAGDHDINYTITTEGVYFARIITESKYYMKKIVVTQ